eukprot:5618867-Prymnesium_polylepis.1
MVLRFLSFVEGVLTKEELLGAALYPEEWWLQAWARNREPTLNLSRQTAQLCRRHDAHNMGSLVPEYSTAWLSTKLRCAKKVPPAQRPQVGIV